MSVVIDAEDQILGRVASFAAKKALTGQKVDIVNAGKAIVTGSKQEVLDKYKNKRSRGVPKKGPHFPKNPDRFVRRTVRGMLPYKKARGKRAFKSVKAHRGVPSEFEGSDFAQLSDDSDISKLKNLKYVYVDEICKELGAKI